MRRDICVCFRKGLINRQLKKLWILFLGGIMNYHVTVDHRESKSNVARALSRTAGVTVSFSHLEIGDYLVDEGLLVERKTIPDFAASIKDGRLLRQASKLASCPVRKAMILEGTAADIPRMRIRREAIQGAIVSVTVIFGIPLLRSRDADESAQLLLYAARQMSATSFRAIPRKGKRPQGKLRIQIHILQGLPLVGPERAQRLLEMFGSVQAVVIADENQLAQISGIGTKVAQAIRWSVGA